MGQTCAGLALDIFFRNIFQHLFQTSFLMYFSCCVPLFCCKFEKESRHFFRPLVSPVVCLIFGIVLMTCSCSSLSADHTVRGGFPRGSPLYCGVKPPPPSCRRLEFPLATFFRYIFQHPFQTSFLMFFSCFFTLFLSHF